MLQIQVEISGRTTGELYRRLRAIADDIRDGQVDGVDNDPELSHEYHVWELEK